MGLKDTLDRWRQYADMSDLGEIARRKFFNNCFDGALTCAGIVSGFLILYLANPAGIVARTIYITGFATALAIGISGLWGAFLSEEAERKKKMDDLKKEMVIIDETVEEDVEISVKIKRTKKKRDKKKGKSIIEEAEDFATIIASLVDGGAPVLGSSLPLIPFFFGSLTMINFVASYAVLVVLLIYLGVFLGKISGGGKAKYAAHLVTAGIVTLFVSLLLGV